MRLPIDFLLVPVVGIEPTKTTILNRRRMPDSATRAMIVSQGWSSIVASVAKITFTPATSMASNYYYSRDTNWRRWPDSDRRTTFLPPPHFRCGAINQTLPQRQTGIGRGTWTPTIFRPGVLKTPAAAITPYRQTGGYIGT